MGTRARFEWRLALSEFKEKKQRCMNLAFYLPRVRSSDLLGVILEQSNN
jgi:hypothetical protein